MKKSLREIAIACRNRLSTDEITDFSLKISASIVTLLQTFKPCSVGLFYPIRGEPNILSIISNPTLHGFDWALPVCGKATTGLILQFAQYGQGDELESGKYNIPVPSIKKWMQPDVLLIPCVGFHKNGARLGYGAGWYDRTLFDLRTPPVTIGIAYSDTEITDNFAEPHDQRLDYIVTERAVLNCRENN